MIQILISFTFYFSGCLPSQNKEQIQKYITVEFILILFKGTDTLKMDLDMIPETRDVTRLF